MLCRIKKENLFILFISIFFVSGCCSNKDIEDETDPNNQIDNDTLYEMEWLSKDEVIAIVDKYIEDYNEEIKTLEDDTNAVKRLLFQKIMRDYKKDINQNDLKDIIDDKLVE